MRVNHVNVFKDILDFRLCEKFKISFLQNLSQNGNPATGSTGTSVQLTTAASSGITPGNKKIFELFI